MTSKDDHHQRLEEAERTIVRAIATVHKTIEGMKMSNSYEQGFIVGRRNGQMFECPYWLFTPDAIQWMLGYSAGCVR